MDDKLYTLINTLEIPEDQKQELLNELNRFRMIRWWGGYSDALVYGIRASDESIAQRQAQVRNNIRHLRGLDDEITDEGLYLL